MWFKNVKAYQITQPLSLDEGDLERALNEHAFRPCGSQDMATMGFASPFSQAGKQGTMFHVVQQRFWITLKKQEKILPSAVVNAELDEMAKPTLSKKFKPACCLRPLQKTPTLMVLSR